MEKEELEKLSFEDALAHLENIVRELEGGRIKLDDAVSAYEQAMQLKKICECKLETAKLKIEKIEKVANGEVVTTDFVVPEE
ncbi:MAG: exodeoxyribonuclease VII small subunit [Alphaproteobacteria bacterium]|nr:exodeoxyribonuclease VII small subunit [Alphaproteobacteria bacterium]